jgi:hypothetical protein
MQVKISFIRFAMLLQISSINISIKYAVLSIC